jgi:hypothetical protein
VLGLPTVRQINATLDRPLSFLRVAGCRDRGFTWLAVTAAGEY